MANGFGLFRAFWKVVLCGHGWVGGLEIGKTCLDKVLVEGVGRLHHRVRSSWLPLTGRGLGLGDPNRR